MKQLFEKLVEKGYPVHNKRLLGNPLHTSEETKNKDFLQEIGLLSDWLVTNHNIWIYLAIGKNPTNFYPCIFHNGKDITFKYYPPMWFDKPKDAYEKCIEYILKELI